MMLRVILEVKTSHRQLRKTYIVSNCELATSTLRTFAPKSSYSEIFFISPLELVHKVLTPKMKKKNRGHRLCFGENGSGKRP